ncbi:TetR/AcrR family transcriptional regulator [Arcticibacterium luteifluviistationis]|uniref:TetR/AcrR family transcriptional regulator n=1 Tax=Arcticibacterium luteifluviistationis TaxID=1784714 RepID=A0A2Z4G983_9BACT|nr:TetR/AcrR family transcriptional regulator [Arcticibacterium luteifluviistationis]AWV97799.1 TetR/AcrR family transcriptional regulator [Arcticibacterium luteifluviistationis]
MPLTKTNKEEIIQTALSVFRKNGYYNTSMSDLATACGLQKGSFYHYFASKEVLMGEVLKTVQSYLDYAVFSIAKQTDLAPRDRMEKMLLKLGKVLLSQEGGCIVGNTTLEVAAQNVIFKDTLKAIFDSWKNALKIIFMEKYPEGTSNRLAEQSVMEFEGAVMFSQLYQTDQYLKDAFVRTLSKMK